MISSLRAFMDTLIDYAGLFPPAALDMDAAVRQYSLHRGEAEAWMLGRFIVPAGRLPELADAAEGLLSPASPWRLSVLVGDRQEASRSLTGIQTQAEAIDRFTADCAGGALVEVLEIPLPADTPGSGVPLFLNALFDELSENGVTGREVFLEISPQAPAAEEQIIVGAVADLAQQRAGNGRDALRIGLKLRCGGVTAEAFPSVERMARIIALCRDAHLPLKCTAGLHHPVRHQCTQPEVMMHGFLNVFGAGLLAHSLGWSAEQLVPVIADTEAESFAFEAGIFRWRDHTVAADQLRRLRSLFLCGFGSCSFDEPRDDLQNLGLL